MFHHVSHHIYSQVWFIMKQQPKWTLLFWQKGSSSLLSPNFTFFALLKKHKPLLSTWKLLLSGGRKKASHRVEGLSYGNSFGCQALKSTATQCQCHNNKTIINNIHEVQAMQRKVRFRGQSSKSELFLRGSELHFLESICSPCYIKIGLHQPSHSRFAQCFEISFKWEPFLN